MFDFQDFIRVHFGNAEGVVRLFKAYKLEPPKLGTADQWSRRNSVPAGSFAQCVVVAEMENGAPVSLCDFLIHEGVKA